MHVYMRSTGPPSGPRSRDSPSSYSRRTRLSKSLKGRTSWGWSWPSGRPWRRRRPGTTAPATRPFVTSVWTTPSTRVCLLKQAWRRPKRGCATGSAKGGPGIGRSNARLPRFRVGRPQGTTPIPSSPRRRSATTEEKREENCRNRHRAYGRGRRDSIRKRKVARGFDPRIAQSA